MGSVFEFDPEKSAANLAKHGIDFDQAQILWFEDDIVEIRVRDGQGDEQRWAVIGTIDGKFWTAIITYRGRAKRLISVRRSRQDEVELYEQQEF
jgi:uncharacterized protein